MLPPTLTLAEYRVLRRDVEAQRPAMETIAARHGIGPGELAPFSHGTQLVWGGERSVVKLFVPLWPDDVRVEAAMLERVTGQPLPVPQMEARGEIDGWPYIVMSRIPGERLADAWPSLGAEERARLAHDAGAAMAGLHALPTTGLESLNPPQGDLVAERIPRLLGDQRDRGGDDALASELETFLAELPELMPARSVLLHADLTADNVLVQGGELSGFIDFADAFVGPWTYELAAPACFMTIGDALAQRALLAGYGVEPSPQLVAWIRAWAVLHRYGHVALMMRYRGHATLRSWMHALWVG